VFRRGKTGLMKKTVEEMDSDIDAEDDDDAF
jgi:hypothetical protein